MMQQYENIHEGERVFIVGNGPSLKRTPLEDLNDETTIAMNKIDIIYGNTSWRPSYYLFSDAGIYGQKNSDIPSHRATHVENNIESGVQCLIEEHGKQRFGKHSNVEYFDNYNQIEPSVWKNEINSGNIKSIFSDDVSEVIYGWGSTIIPAIQIAVYMGFDDIFFIGTDLYEEKSISLFDGAATRQDIQNTEFKSKQKPLKLYELISQTGKPIRSILNVMFHQTYPYLPNRFKSDPNHFSSTYQPNRLYSAEEMNKNFRLMHTGIKKLSNKWGFDVYNATIGGHLEIYPRVGFSEILSD